MTVTAVETNDPKTRVIHVNRKRGTEDEVYIGRGGPWGNPFRIGRDGDREAVIRKFAEWMTGNSLTARRRRSQLHTLKGKTLVCFCKPRACHGDVLAEMADAS